MTAPTCHVPGGATSPPWYAVDGRDVCVSCKDRAGSSTGAGAPEG